MPKMPDAEIVIAGKALFTEGRTVFESNPPQPNGADVSVLGTQGLAIVRFSQDDVKGGALPQTGADVALVATGSSWAQDRGASNVVYRFVRHAGGNELDALHKSIKAAGNAA